MDNRNEQEFEKKAEEAIDELKINLPGPNLPPILRFLSLFMLVGGLSIMGSIFADIVDPTKTNLSFYLLRILVGSLVIITAYGIIKLQRWALWAYGLALFVGLLVNPIVVVLPMAVLFYLYIHKDKFTPSIFDNKLYEVINFIESKFKKEPPQVT